ncbi:hypothetical protein PoMZ_09352 [Pyricularia oryzae]|uniref:Uncharacterized protein n=1 Tax=Pyricularia oryzae TaxID=318829 RepID=A0A4P7N1H1_PYROR|nr:hypothetical protein PoMZ_09352 [Pyricularia oryzae]
MPVKPTRQLDASAHPGSAPTSSAGTTPPSSRPHSRREDPPSLPPPLLVLCAAERAKLQSFKGYARARDFFRGMCNAGQQFPRGTTVFINLGSAMAYMCNYDVDNRSDEASEVMDAGCVPDSAAAVQVDFCSKMYGRENKEDTIS